jgi:hypothetical protein
MLTADKVKLLTTMGPTALKLTLASSGYTGQAFKSAKFVGITNGGQFCYQVTYFDDACTGKDEIGKVFVAYNHANDSITADF